MLNIKIMKKLIYCFFMGIHEQISRAVRVGCLQQIRTQTDEKFDLMLKEDV